MALLETDEIFNAELGNGGLEAPEAWRDLINELAPKPEEDAEVVDPRAVIRYAVARCVTNRDEPIPAEIVDPKNDHKVRVILAEIAGIEELPDYCRDKILEIQTTVNPELVRVVKRNMADTISMRLRDSALRLGELTTSRESWVGQAVCIKEDANPGLFHLSLVRAQRHRNEDDVKVFQNFCSEAISYCNRCPVTEECLEFGLLSQDPESGPIVAGGHYINLNVTGEGQVINLLDHKTTGDNT